MQQTLTTRRKVLLGLGGLTLTVAGGALACLQNMGSMERYNESVAASRAALLGSPGLREFVRYATLAANGHNTQPWKFRVGSNQIELMPDFSRRTPCVDPDDHHLFVSLGCAAENLAIAAAAYGNHVDCVFHGANGGALLCSFEQKQAVKDDLFQAIPSRQSTRSDYDGRRVSRDELKRLAKASAVQGVEVVFITDARRMDQVRDLVVSGNTEQIADQDFIKELKMWLRFSPREAMRTADGLFAASSGSPTLPNWLGQGLFSQFFQAEGENDKYARQIRSSAGLAVFTGQDETKESWVRAGRSCQRFALQATALGLKHAFINQPVEVASLREGLATVAGSPGRRPDLLMRFGYGAELPFSARRPIEAVLV